MTAVIGFAFTLLFLNTKHQIKKVANTMPKFTILPQLRIKPASTDFEADALFTESKLIEMR